MEFDALVVYIKFDGEHTMWNNMIDIKHSDFTVLPQSIERLKDNINESFEHIVPLIFRELYALREFDMVGVFKHDADKDAIMEQIHNYVAEENIHTLKINSCYGEVGYLSDEVDFKRIVHHMWGKAVYGAIKY